jgi:hypothetical protein
LRRKCSVTWCVGPLSRCDDDFPLVEVLIDFPLFAKESRHRDSRSRWLSIIIINQGGPNFTGDQSRKQCSR